MSISTYAELQTAVASWTHRAGLTSFVADFIQQGESLLNRKLRTVDMENAATLTASTLTRFLALPTGFVEMESLWRDDPREEIIYLPPSQMASAIVTSSNLPKYFTIGSHIEFDRIPDSAYSLECRYFKRYNLASDLTNTLLTNHPEIYLHAALASASVYTASPMLATFRGLVEDEIIELNRSEARKRGNGLAILRTELITDSFDIIRGDS